MENSPRDVNLRGKSVGTNKPLSLRNRPTATNSLQDLGSSFIVPNTGTRRSAKVARNTALETENRGKAAPVLEIDESDDELLLSSQPSTAAAVEEDNSPWSPMKTHKQKSRANATEECSRVQHQESQTRNLHTSEVVKTLKFHKNKTGNDPKTNTPAQEPFRNFSQKLLPSQKPLDKVYSTDHSKRSCDYIFVASDPPASKCVRRQSPGPSINDTTPRPKPYRKELALEEIPVNSQTKPFPMKIKANDCSESALKSQRKPTTDANVTRRSTLTPVHPIDKPKPEPGVKAKADLDPYTSIKKPRIPKPSSQNHDPESSSEVSRPRRGPKTRANLNHGVPSTKKPRVSKSTGRTPESESSTEASKPLRIKPQNFPHLSPLHSQKQADASRCPPALKCKSKQEKLGPKPFPMPLPEGQLKGSSVTDSQSNLKRQSPGPSSLILPDEKKSPNNFNDLSDVDEQVNSKKPRPRPKRPKADRGTRKASKKDEKKSYLPTPQPFPMNAQMLKDTEADGIVSSSKPRKRKSSISVMVTSDESVRDSGCDWDEDFSVTLSVDPKSLCPFCDVLLPEPVSPLLRKLINSALKKSRHDPRPGNPLGRKAPSAIFITVCQRHTFEREELPKAEANGWPKNIDWEQLGNRINAMQDDLGNLLSDLRAGTSSSPLWGDVKRELQAKGSRAVASVREQFANFEKAQAGYYGELGYAIIHQSLLDLFPPTSYDLEFANPLTPEQFVQRVLVPEVALRLIQEDMDLRGPTHIAKALQVLRDSSKYGVAMFPDDNDDHGNSMSLGDSDQLGIADMIVMERARKRRQELEEEYRKEQEEQEFQRNEERKKDRERIKRTKNKTVDKRARERSNPTKEETEHETEEDILRPKPRPLRNKRSASVFSQASTAENSGYEGSEECFSTLPYTSQKSFTPSEFNESSDNDFFMRSEEILVPDSDEGEEGGAHFSVRGRLESIPSQATIATEPASEQDTDMAFSSESSPTTSNQRKKQRDWEDEESTPKPAKLPRTGVPGTKGSNSHPLLLARQRRRQPSGSEAARIANSNDNEIWVKSMMTPMDVAGNTLRRQWSLEFSWILSDGSQE